jgi:hypothetical protein
MQELIKAALAAAGFVEGERFEVGIKPTAGGMWARTFTGSSAAAAYLASGPEGDRYIGLNPIRPDADPPKGRCRDEDVLANRTLLIDCDPNDTSQEARGAALEMAKAIRSYIFEQFGVLPVLIDSGRGQQVWLRHEPTDEDRGPFLKQLAARFHREGAKVDVACSNRSRFARMPGTVNTKTGEVARIVDPGDGKIARLVLLAPDPLDIPIAPEGVNLESLAGGLDFRTAPAPSEGERHNACKKIAAAHFRRGEDAYSVLQAALKWGDKCGLDTDEVSSVIDWFAKKEDEKRPPVLEQPSVAWPVLHVDAHYGLAWEIAAKIEPETETDPVAILIQVLVFFGNVVGRSAFVEVEATRHHANLFAVIVGSTSRARKGTSEQRVRAIFKDVDSEWLKRRVVTGMSSGEGLIWAVRDPIEKMEKQKDGTTELVVTDPGVSDKRLLVIESEFAAPLRIMKRDGNTLSAIVRCAWDGLPLQIMTRKDPVRATGAYVSIIGHVTKDELAATLNTEVEGFNGFANRFWWVCVTRSKLLPDGGKPVDMTALVGRLASAVDFAREAGSVTRDADASALWRDLYERIAKDAPGGLLEAATSRGEAQVLRMSLVFALLDSSNVIRVPHVRAAYALWRYAADSARYVFGSSTGDGLADEVLAVVATGPTTRTDLHRSLGNHVSSRDLDRVLRKLAGAGRIKREKQATPGRPAEVWRLA